MPPVIVGSRSTALALSARPGTGRVPLPLRPARSQADEVRADWSSADEILPTIKHRHQPRAIPGGGSLLDHQANAQHHKCKVRREPCLLITTREMPHIPNKIRQALKVIF